MSRTEGTEPVYKDARVWRHLHVTTARAVLIAAVSVFLAFCVMGAAVWYIADLQASGHASRVKDQKAQQTLNAQLTQQAAELRVDEANIRALSLANTADISQLACTIAATVPTEARQAPFIADFIKKYDCPPYNPAIAKALQPPADPKATR